MEKILKCNDLITLVDFLLYFDKAPDYSKKDIDKGNTPPEIYKICCSMRTAFCTSYGIKKKNNLYIYFRDDSILINFNGRMLKYLGPDERNQALLLRKAIDKIKSQNSQKSMTWIKSTPGIQVKYLNNSLSFINFLNSLDKKKFTFICESISPFNLNFLYHYYDYPRFIKLNRLKNMKDHFFIIPSSKNIVIEFLREIARDFTSMLEYFTLATQKKIKSMADKVLYLNFQIDQEGN